MYFLTVLGIGSPRSRYRQDWCLVRALALSGRQPPSRFVITRPLPSAHGERASSQVSLLTRTLIRADQEPIFMTSLNLNYFLTPNTVPLGGGFQHELKRTHGHIDSVHNIWYVTLRSYLICPTLSFLICKEKLVPRVVLWRLNEANFVKHIIEFLAYGKQWRNVSNLIPLLFCYFFCFLK